MADIPPPTSSAPPPQGGAAPARPGGAAAQALGVTANSLPGTLDQALSRAGAGGLEAQVAASARGQLTLQLPQGQLVVSTPQTLPQGATVQLALQSAGPPATLSLTLQAGTAGAASSGAATPGAAGPAGAAGAPAVVTSIPQGLATTATVLSGSAGPASAAPTAGSPGPAPSAGQAAGAAPGAGTAGARAGGQGALPAGAQVPVRILAVAPPGQPLPPLPGAVQAGALTGAVLSGAPQGMTLVQTPAGTLGLPAASPPPDSTIALRLTGQPTLPRADAPVAGGGSSGGFQALGEALGGLSAQAAAGPAGAAALQSLRALIPQPGPQLAAAALFFMLAGRAPGGARGWAGAETAEAIARAQGGLLERLSGELGGLEGRARDGAGGDWRMTALPMLMDGELEEVRLYRREDEGGAARGDGPDDGPKRFIVEARFETLGTVQLDTLSREGHVAVMLRSRTGLDEALRDGIRALFADTMSALGKTGEIGFQRVARFDVGPVAEADALGGETTA